MNKLLKTEAMKRLTKGAKSKRGATLIELVATVAILSIIASLSFEAMFIAAEEFRRVRSISESERSIALFQDNLNLYAKNAVDVELVKNSDKVYGSATTIDDVIWQYIFERGSIPTKEPLQDAMFTDEHQYIDLFVYRSGDFTYAIGKYEYGSSKLRKLVEIENIKEINFVLKKLGSSFSDMTTESYILDYAVVSPTNFEIVAADKHSVASGEVIDKNNYSNKEGSYSVMSGVVLNNITGIENTSLKSLRICEDLRGVTTEGNDYKGDFNFIVIRTVPREAK